MTVSGLNDELAIICCKKKYEYNINCNVIGQSPQILKLSDLRRTFFTSAMPGALGLTAFQCALLQACHIPLIMLLVSLTNFKVHVWNKNVDQKFKLSPQTGIAC